MKNALRIGLALGGGAQAALAWLLMRYDRGVIATLYLRPLGLIEIAKVLNYPGSWMVLIPLVALCLAVFWRPGWVWLALRPMGALFLAEAIAEPLKIYLHRPRPNTI